MDQADLDNRFTFHEKSRSLNAEKHQLVREVCGNLAETMNAVLPEGREKALVLTKLEEAMFWANAAIARAD
jgi:hypothetical protein